MFAGTQKERSIVTMSAHSVALFRRRHRRRHLLGARMRGTTRRLISAAAQRVKSSVMHQAIALAVRMTSATGGFSIRKVGSAGVALLVNPFALASETVVAAIHQQRRHHQRRHQARQRHQRRHRQRQHHQRRHRHRSRVDIRHPCRMLAWPAQTCFQSVPWLVFGIQLISGLSKCQLTLSILP